MVQGLRIQAQGFLGFRGKHDFSMFADAMLRRFGILGC